MAAVRWSRRAEARLATIGAATREQLLNNVEKVLHAITSRDFPHDEGTVGQVMWHRGIPCGMLSEELLAQEDDDGPWNYFLFYVSLPPKAGDPARYPTFEILDVCGIAEVARRWVGGGRDGTQPPE